MSPKLRITSAVAVLLLACLLACGGVGKPKVLPEKSADVNLHDLLTEWGKSPVATHEKYSNIRVRTTGMLRDVFQTFGSRAAVRISDEVEGFASREFTALVDEERLLSDVSKCNKGDRVAVEVVFDRGFDSPPRATLIVIGVAPK